MEKQGGSGEEQGTPSATSHRAPVGLGHLRRVKRQQESASPRMGERGHLVPCT